MNPLLRASVIAALALTSLAAEAAARRPCITTLEAQAGSAPSDAPAPPKKPCPVAVAYTPASRAVDVPRDVLRDAAPDAPRDARIDAREPARAPAFASTLAGARA